MFNSTRIALCCELNKTVEKVGEKGDREERERKKEREREGERQNRH